MLNNWKEETATDFKLLYLKWVTIKVFWESDAVIRLMDSDVSKEHAVFIFSGQAVHEERFYTLSNTL